MSEAFVGGKWRTLSKGEAYIGGKWRALTHGEMCLDEAWQQVFNFVPPMSVAVSPSIARGFVNPLKPTIQQVTTVPLTASPTGGKAPYSYHWTITSHTGTSPVLNSPNSASTTASAMVAANSEQQATAHVTVTDALGSTSGADGLFSFINQSQIG